MTSPIRVFIADSTPQVRQGIRALLGLDPTVQVIGEAKDGTETLKAVTKLQPDVVLAENSLPRISGPKLALRLAKSHPDVSVVILSMESDRRHVLEARQAGVKGYLQKNLLVDLVPAIRQAKEGQRYYSASASRHLVRESKAKSPSKTPSANLSTRQMQMLKLIAEGFTTVEIADKLDISFKTAETHRSVMMNKLGVSRLAEVVHHAIRMGLVTV